MYCNIDGSHGEYVLYRLTNRILTRYCPYQSRSTTNQHLNSQNPRGHHRTEHLDAYRYFIRDTAQNGDFIIHWISGKDNPADMFIKSLPRPSLDKIKADLHITQPSFSTNPRGISHSLLLRHFDCAAGVLLASGGVHILSC